VEIESEVEPIFLTRTAVGRLHDLADTSVAAEGLPRHKRPSGCVHDADDSERLGLVAEHHQSGPRRAAAVRRLLDFSESPTERCSPLVGEQARRIIERLGYASQETEELLTRGVVRTHRGLSLAAPDR
jgi:crotonobetainyl-CoA:carnitine CoA-transferase CaiB-like acyl-CoA transferase